MAKMPTYTIVVKVKDDNPDCPEVNVDYPKEFDDWRDIPTRVWKISALALRDIYRSREGVN